jgi:hypothetical protein
MTAQIKNNHLYLYCKESTGVGDCGAHSLICISIVYLAYETTATYKHRTSASPHLVELALKEYHIHEAFVHDLLGRPDYWSSISHKVKESSSLGDDYG